MFAMSATLKPRAMAAYTGSSSNTSRERVLRVSLIGRLSDDPSSKPCEGRCKTSIDCFTSEEQERERRGLRMHRSMDCRQVFEQALRVPCPTGCKETRSSSAAARLTSPALRDSSTDNR